MSGITRYILRQLTVGMIFVSAALACVLWLSQSLRLIELIVNKGISVGVFLLLSLLLMPTFLVVIIPISLFAVSLFTYNRLNADRELVVMRAAGLSHWALSKPALILAMAATVFGYVLTLWLIPLSVQSFREMQWSIRNDLSNVLLQEGAFNKFGSGLTIYIRARSADGELLGILVHDRRKADKPVTLMAERGALVFTENGPRVLMINGNRQQVTEGEGEFSLLYFDRYTVDMDTAMNGGGERFRDARERSTSELLHLHKSSMGDQEYRRAKVELHNRITSPLYNVSFAMIALAILLPAGFDRRGQTGRILMAVGLMVALQAAALGVSNLSTGRLLFVPLMYLIAVLPIGVGIRLLVGPLRPRRSGGVVGAHV